MHQKQIYSHLASILTAFVALFGPIKASSSPNQCASLFSSDYGMNGRLEVISSVSGALPISKYEKRITDINNLLGKLLPPDESSIKIGSIFSFSTYDPIDGRIYVGIRPQSMGLVNPEVNLTTLTHEYGHAVFEKNLLQSSAQYRKLKSEVLKMNESDNHDAFSKIQPAWLIRSGIHEVFADVLTLVTTKDPKSISKIQLDKLDEQQSTPIGELLLRDFTSGRKSQSFLLWSYETHNQSINNQNIYFSFLPVRWELWKIIKSRLDGSLYQKQLLTKVFNILEKNLNKALDVESNKTEDIIKLNQQIIKDLRNEL